jgi:hypothetical protein
MLKIIDCASCGLPYIGTCRICREMPPASQTYLRALHGLQKGDRQTLRPLTLFESVEEAVIECKTTREEGNMKKGRYVANHRRKRTNADRKARKRRLRVQGLHC